MLAFDDPIEKILNSVFFHSNQYKHGEWKTRPQHKQFHLKSKAWATTNLLRIYNE